eukprot:1028084-Pelagomonas_calceolata.AAC.3
MEIAQQRECTAGRNVQEYSSIPEPGVTTIPYLIAELVLDKVGGLTRRNAEPGSEAHNPPGPRGRCMSNLQGNS